METRDSRSVVPRYNPGCDVSLDHGIRINCIEKEQEQQKQTLESLLEGQEEVNETVQKVQVLLSKVLEDHRELSVHSDEIRAIKEQVADIKNVVSKISGLEETVSAQLQQSQDELRDQIHNMHQEIQNDLRSAALDFKESLGDMRDKMHERMEKTEQSCTELHEIVDKIKGVIGYASNPIIWKVAVVILVIIAFLGQETMVKLLELLRSK